MIRIKKLIEPDTGIEYLDEYPEQIVNMMEQGTKSQQKLAQLYILIAKEQNYFQKNTATAFGNPEYSRLQGMVTGYVSGADYDYEESESKIIISNHQRTKVYMIIEKPKLRASYHDEIRETRKIISNLF